MEPFKKEHSVVETVAKRKLESGMHPSTCLATNRLGFCCCFNLWSKPWLCSVTGASYKTSCALVSTPVNQEQWASHRAAVTVNPRTGADAFCPHGSWLQRGEGNRWGHLATEHGLRVAHLSQAHLQWRLTGHLNWTWWQYLPYGDQQMLPTTRFFTLPESQLLNIYQCTTWKNGNGSPRRAMNFCTINQQLRPCL